MEHSNKTSNIRRGIFFMRIGKVIERFNNLFMIIQRFNTFRI